MPRKNLRPIGGVSLIARSIRAAKAAVSVNGVWVSTDDPEIAAIAEAEGAAVVWRPLEIAGDSASSESALIHALDILAEQNIKPERLVFLQCTSPFTRGSDIDACVSALDDGEIDAAFSGKEDHGFYWSVQDGRAVGVNHDETQPRKRRQDLPPQFRETGAIYVVRVSKFRTVGSRFCGATVVVPIDSPFVEIDTLEDLELCNAIAQRDG